jgi:hypothetical protein
MYRSCIFCSAGLGANAAIEHFPVGRRVAFDAARGRLWAVCPKCARWNLAPIEERWEAVEEAERTFRDSRLRAQSENIGLARLPDGTRLIRVGAAVPGELAAWRYGSQLVHRRRRYLIAGGITLAGGLAVVGGLAALSVGGGMVGMWTALAASWEEKQAKKVVHRIAPEESPTGAEVTVRRWHVQGARLAERDGGIALVVPDTHQKKRRTDGWGRAKYTGVDDVELSGAAARSVLNRAMVVVNHRGASRQRVTDAVRLLQDSHSAEDYLRHVARTGGVLGKRKGMEGGRIPPAPALALEMALHDEQERRALEGELWALEAAWRRAEEIADIADRLPELPPPDPPDTGAR